MNDLLPLQQGDADIALSVERTVFIAAMGFEDRALEFPAKLSSTACSKGIVLAIHYAQAKGANREAEFQALFEGKANWQTRRISYSSTNAHKFEITLGQAIGRLGLRKTDAIIVDVSAMSKFLIMVVLVRLWADGFVVRIVMTTAAKYTPTREEYEATMSKYGQAVRAFAGQPSMGVAAILRSSCLLSTRMQGQPTCAVAFTSFNEELIRHAIGTLNPRRLILINGRPPSQANAWRAAATQTIHSRLVEEYSGDNPLDSETGMLTRTVSTLNYEETVAVLEELHARYGLYERMIYFATGSKMQAVALAIHKHRHSDVHIEYPTPDSYYFEEYSKSVGNTYWTDL